MTSHVGWLRFGALALVCLLVSHHIVFMVAYGTGRYESAMEAGGHASYWPSFVVLIASAFIVLVAVTVRQLRRLQRIAAQLATGEVEIAGRDDIVRGSVILWLRLTIATGTLFVIQENLEHLSVGSRLPWLGALGGPEYGPALPVIMLVSLLIAVMSELLRWRRDLLIRRIEQARAALRSLRSERQIRRPLVVVIRRGSAIGGCLAGRAPPTTSAA